MRHGSIDKISRKEISGWVNDDKKAGPLLVDLIVNGETIVKNFEASLYRPDLQRKSIGDGFRGFVIVVDLPQERDDYTVALCVAGTTDLLVSKTVEILPQLSRFTPMNDGNLGGFLVWTEIYSDEKFVQVEIRVNGVHLCSTVVYAPKPGDNRAYFEVGLDEIFPALEKLYARHSAKQHTDETKKEVPLAHLTLHRVIEGNVGPVEAKRALSYEEIKLLSSLQQRRTMQNALLLRKALEAGGLWYSKPLDSAQIEAATNDPALLCLDVEYLKQYVENFENDSNKLQDASSALAYFRTVDVRLNPGPNLLFAEAWYRSYHKNIAQALICGNHATGLDHFLAHGLDAGFAPHAGLSAPENDDPFKVSEFLKRLITDTLADLTEVVTFTQPDVTDWASFRHMLIAEKKTQSLIKSSSFAENLRDRNWVLINTNTHTRNIHITRAMIDDARSLFGIERIHVATYENVVSICSKLNFPMLLCIDGQRLNTPILENAIRYCNSAALWTFDDPYNLNSHLRVMDLFDVIFTNDLSCLPAYGDKGFYLPLAAPEKLTKEPIQAEPTFDIFFCGTAWPNRITLINRLKTDRPELRFKIALTYNAAVPPLPLDAPVSTYLQSLSFADYIGYARRSRITLALHRSFSGTDDYESSSNPGPRVFEIGALGAYQISENGGEGFEALLPRDHIDYYDEYEELLALVDAAIAQPEKRKVSALALRNSIAAKHTYYHRLETIAIELARAHSIRPTVMPTETRKRPRLLYVVHNTIHNPPFGGLEVHQDILSSNLRDRYDIFFFYTAIDDSKKERWGILTDGNYKELKRSDRTFGTGHGNLQHNDLEAFLSLCLAEYDFDLVHFFQFIHGTPSMANIVRSFGVPYGISFHDFYTACRQFNLLDHTGRFCHNDHTKLADCDLCLKKQYNFPPKSQMMRRDYFGEVLARASTLMFVSRSAKEIHEGIYPQIALAGARRIHGAPIPNPQWSIIETRRGPKNFSERSVRFLILGNLNEHKGSSYLLDALMVCPDIQAEFHVHGHVPDSTQSRYKKEIGDKAIFHGTYAPGELNLKNYDFSLHLSIWPETYCQTLSEAWAARIVPIVNDIGAIGQRVSHGVNGYKVDPERPATLARLLMEITADPEKHFAISKHITDELFLDQPEHAQLYDEAYRDVLQRAPVRPPRLDLKKDMVNPVTMEVLQKRRRTSYWDRGKGARPDSHEHSPVQADLSLLGRIEKFSGTVTHIKTGSIDSAKKDSKPVDESQVTVLKNSEELVVSGWSEKIGMINPQPVAVLSQDGVIHLYPLSPMKRKDVAKAFNNPSAEEWGMEGSIRLLTPDRMLVGTNELSIGWHDRSNNLLRIYPSKIRVKGKFGA